jgi:hypothetical protein
MGPMRYRLRTLLIVLALGPPVLAGGWWKYTEWKAEQEREMLRRGDGRGWASIRGPTPPGAIEVPIEQNSYWHHETINPRKP